MKRLIWAGPAIRDIAAILDHYEAIDPELAAGMLDKIIAAPSLLLERPLLGEPLGLRGARKWSVRGAPLILRYRIATEHVEVLRVHHSAQDWRTP